MCIKNSEKLQFVQFKLDAIFYVNSHVLLIVCLFGPNSLLKRLELFAQTT